MDFEYPKTVSDNNYAMLCNSEIEKCTCVTQMADYVNLAAKLIAMLAMQDTFGFNHRRLWLSIVEK